MKYVDPTFLARSRAAFLSENQSHAGGCEAPCRRRQTPDRHPAPGSRLGAEPRRAGVRDPLEKLEASPRRVRELFASKSPPR